MATKHQKKGLQADLDDQIAKLHEKIGDALNQFDADAIHDARVATRRIAAALDLLKPVLTKSDRKSLGGGLKKIRRRLGPLRDADVMLERVATLAARPKLTEAARWLEGRLQQWRHDLRREKSGGPSKELKRLSAWPAVRHETHEAADAIAGLLAESLHAQTDCFTQQADRLVATLQPADDAISPAQRQDPHELRISGKSLRYTLEMAQSHSHPPGRRLMIKFKQMQDTLGAWHDLVVLAERAMKEALDADLLLHDAALADRVLRLVRYLMREASRQLQGFVRLWQRHGAEIAAQIRSSYTFSRPLASQAEDVPESRNGHASAPSVERDATRTGEAADPSTDRDPPATQD